MKKVFYILCLCTLGCIFFVSACNNAPETQQIGGIDIPLLQERTNIVGSAEEARDLRERYDKAVAALKANPEDRKPCLDLATIFFVEGRATGNNSYYSTAAVMMTDLLIDGNTADKDLQFQAWSLRSAVLLNMHQFKDALAAAQKGLALNDYNASIWGDLVDAYVELGDYTEAVKACDKMLSIRPDLRSYSRASYLRQIHGDNAGAIEAMNMAVQAGVPGAESTEWARITLADLYLNTGKTDSAEALCRHALAYRPNYPPASMGLSRAAAARQQYDTAISYARQAIQTWSESSFVSYLADLYELKGDAGKAAETRAEVVRLLEEAEKEQNKKGSVPHNGSRELAAAYLANREYDKALEYALKDLQTRPGNIDANELAAWICYRKKDYAQAKQYADKMLRMNTRNAGSLYKASLIYAAAGETAKSAEMNTLARSQNAYIDQRLLVAAH